MVYPKRGIERVNSRMDHQGAALNRTGPVRVLSTRRITTEELT